MVDIFISYARVDRPWVFTFASTISTEGWDVWWDRDIPVGASFQRVIVEALEQARCVCVVWSSAALESDWVLAEAEDGRSRGILAPLLKENVRIPVPFNVINCADLTEWNGDRNHPGFHVARDKFRRLLGEPEKVSTAEAVRLIKQFCDTRRIRLSQDLEEIISSSGAMAVSVQAADRMGTAYCHTSGLYSKQVFYVRKGISIFYHTDHQGPGGALGLPISNEELADGSGFPTSYFENGLIEWNPSTWEAQAYLLREGDRIPHGPSRRV
jgi:hypothetical protein